MSRITIDIGNTRLKLRADGGAVIGLAHAGDPATVLRGRIARSVDAAGALQVQTANGELRAVHAGDVSVRAVS